MFNPETTSFEELPDDADEDASREFLQWVVTLLGIMATFGGVIAIGLLVWLGSMTLSWP